MTNQELIDDLRQRTEWSLAASHRFLSLTDEQLNQREDDDRWSVLECLEHLNRYGYYYLPEITKTIATAATSSASMKFTSGWMGNKMALSLQPGDEGTKMKTFKNMNPIGSQLNRKVIDIFIAQQEETLNLLERCRTVNLSKLKTGITLTKFIRLRLGDTLRVVIYHNQRHVEQAERVLVNTKD